MNSFTLKIVTPDGLKFDGNAEELIVRTVNGDMGILAGHVNCVAPLGMGQAMILAEGKKRYAACIGGMVSVVNGKVTLVPTTFEWADEIDVKRAEVSAERAQKILKDKSSTDTDLRLAEARLKRALVRKSIVQE
jgi:F-type H+-transporting ATPase subunit epsilon